MFTYGEPSRKAKVRCIGNDTGALVSHNANMSRRRARPVEILEDLRRTSGWYLAAWRDYRGLTLDEMVSEVGSSKGAISELESCRPRADGTIPRWNRDTLETMSRALNVGAGHLIDINPYTADPEWLQILDKLRGLDQTGRATAVRLVSQLEPPKKADNGS